MSKFPINSEERELLRIALTAPEAMQYLMETVNLQPDMMTSDIGVRIWGFVRLSYGKPDFVNWLLFESGISADDRIITAASMVPRDAVSPHWAKYGVKVPGTSPMQELYYVLEYLRERKAESDMFNKMTRGEQ